MISTIAENPFQEILAAIVDMKERQSRGEPFDKEAFRKFEEITEKPIWGPFYGYNLIRIPNFEIHWGGGVSFIKHIGKPLSPELWKDVTMRLQAEYIQIYRPNDTIPCVATSYGQVNIKLDENDNVRDIYYTPHWRK